MLISAKSRLFSLAVAFLAAVMLVPAIHADELTDGTVTIPRSGKEIVSLPSPEAAGLCRHIDHAIDYSTGCVSLSFPLFTYDCGGITLPLSISYRTGGIKADTEAGALGVGWDLNFGGCVTRSVVGLPDDAPNVEFSTTKSTFEFLKKLHNNIADAMYDRYSFSAGSCSGSFIIRNKTEIQHLTPTDARVVRTASGFDITTPDGTLYRFDIPEILDYKYNPAPYSAASTPPAYTCQSMWRLSRIVSSSRTDSVTLAYEAIPDLYKSSTQETIAASWDSGTKKVKWAGNSPAQHIKAIATHKYSNRHRIASISGRGSSVTFYYDATNRERCTGLTVKNNLGSTVRKLTFGSGRTLTNYRITDDASNLLDGADFSYFMSMGTDDDRDFFGYRNGGGHVNAVSYDPDSLSIENDPEQSALDKLMRPSWKRQPVFTYTVSESLRSVSTVAGTNTVFDYEPNDGGYFLTYGRIAPGVRLKKETVTDRNTQNVRTRALTYSAPVPSIDFSALIAEDFVSVSGSYLGPLNQQTTVFTTGASLAASCRLQGAAPENACVYYGKVTETITGTGINASYPIVTDYVYDTSNACSKLILHGNRWSVNDKRVAGGWPLGVPIFTETYDLTPGGIYERLITTNAVRGYFKEIIGDRAPLKMVKHWRTDSSDPSGRKVWKQTKYYHSRTTENLTLGNYSENMLRVVGGPNGPDIYSWESYDFRSVDDFNRFGISAKSVKVYVDSIIEIETDVRDTDHTVIRRMGYNNHPLKWLTGTGGLKPIPLSNQPAAASDSSDPITIYSYLADPKIAGRRYGPNSLLNACIVGCGDEWIRTDYIYSSTSDTPQMRQLDAAGRISLPVENYYTTGHGFDYDSTAVSERFTYVTGRNAYDMRLSSDVIRSKSAGAWFTLDSISVGAHDSYGNPLLVSRNGGTPSYYRWSDSGTTLASATTAGQTTTYTWTPLVGCTSAKAPSGLLTEYGYSGSRLTSVKVGGTLAKSYSYSVRGTSSTSTAPNYVSELTVTDAASSQSVNSRTFYDGFGNPMGTVTADRFWSSPVATYDVYDAFGRLIRSYTPRPAATPGAVPSAPNPSGDNMPYSVITYSRSGDSRPLTVTIPGEEFSGHHSQTRHLFSVGHTAGAESVLSCRRYRPGAAAGSVTFAGYYPQGALSVEETTDGDGRLSLTFTDYRGRLILTRSVLDAGVVLKDVQSGGWTDTYNVYDDAGNLVTVITPVAAPLMATKGSSWSAAVSGSPLSQCFTYSYDGHMRLSAKKTPDAAEVKYCYDATGALILTQDGEQRSRGVCSFVLPDSLGRAAVTGECSYSAALAASVGNRHVVATRSAQGALNGYTANIVLSSADIFSSSYYDDYSFLSLGCFSRLSSKIAARPLPAHKTTPRGLPTGSWTKLLGSSSAETLLNDSIAIASKGYLESTSSVLCYDSRDRLTATATADHLGGLCLDTSVYNDAAMPLTTTFTRWPLLASEATETHSYSYTYDALARVSSVTLARGDSVYTVERNTYDEIGRLISSARGNGCNVAFSYKPSGAVASIAAKNGAGVASFLQSLRYATGATPSYSGNVGSVDWSGNDRVLRRYGFSYDGLGRLETATYSEPVGRPSSSRVSGTPSYSTTYTYGADSRPLSVRRQGVRMFLSHPTDLIPVFGEVDNLEFSYNGSRLTKVDDSAAAIIYSGASDFNDGADAATEYTYDSDGRLTSDANKGITSIRYNAIGLPAVVTFADGSSITNRYGADGSLLQRVKAEPIKSIVLAAAATPVIRPTTTTVTDNHIGPLTIRTTSAKANAATTALARIDTPSGYIADGRMHYYVKDYQGNVRQVTDADGKVEQDNHYYPYGMLMAESSDILTAANGTATTTNSLNPYLYGGKEYLTTGSANLLDFTARTYDPTTLLFHTQDPESDVFTPFNPYNYCGGEPVNRVDKDGKQFIAVSPLIPTIGVMPPALLGMADPIMMASNKPIIPPDILGRMPGRIEWHHIIPRSLIGRSTILKQAIKQGFKIDGKRNLTPVEKFLRITNRGRHGNHPRYSKQIENLLKDFMKENPNAKDAVNKTIEQALRVINENPTTKINDLELLNIFILINLEDEDFLTPYLDPQLENEDEVEDEYEN